MHQTLKLTRWAWCHTSGDGEVIAKNDPGQGHCPVCGRNLTDLGRDETERSDR